MDTENNQILDAENSEEFDIDDDMDFQDVVLDKPKHQKIQMQDLKSPNNG